MPADERQPRAAVERLGDLPVKVVNGVMVYIHDVAQVRDGFIPQTNIVRQDGHRGDLATILKSGAASTLDIIDRVKEVLPRVRSTLPPELVMKPEFDQSIFVRAALYGVIKEASSLAALLTAAMILVFLGTWRNTLVVALSIPLSIFCSILCLYALGQTINAMTLGGLALAVGILVDDATVEIENIDRNLHMKKPLVKAILDGAQQIAVPAFVSTLCICIVFVPIFFLQGTAKFLFGPLAMAVIFAMLASYFLSRTVVPTFVHYLLLGRKVLFDDGHGHADSGDVFWRIHVAFNRRFERFRSGYSSVLERCLNHRGAVLVIMVAAVVVSAPLAYFFIGQGLLPRGRRGAVPAPRARAGRDQDRGHREVLHAGRGHHPPGDPARGAGHHHRQHRPAEREAPASRSATPRPSARPTGRSSPAWP